MLVGGWEYPVSVIGWDQKIKETEQQLLSLLEDFVHLGLQRLCRFACLRSIKRHQPGQQPYCNQTYRSNQCQHFCSFELNFQKSQEIILFSKTGGGICYVGGGWGMVIPGEKFSENFTKKAGSRIEASQVLHWC